MTPSMRCSPLFCRHLRFTLLLLGAVISVLLLVGLAGGSMQNPGALRGLHVLRTRSDYFEFHGLQCERTFLIGQDISTCYRQIKINVKGTKLADDTFEDLSFAVLTADDPSVLDVSLGDAAIELEPKMWGWHCPKGSTIIVQCRAATMWERIRHFLHL